MNKSPPPSNTVFNAPAEMAARALLLVGLAAAAAASALVVTGGFSQQPLLVLFGGLGFVFSALLLLWLRRTGRLDRASGAFEESISEMEDGAETLDGLQRTSTLGRRWICGARSPGVSATTGTGWAERRRPLGFAHEAVAEA